MVVEQVAGAVHHADKLLVPLVLLLRAPALEHERTLQILDLDAVVGARSDALLDLEGAVAQHDKARRVVVLAVQVDEVGVLQYEPTLVVAQFKVLAANAMLPQVAIVDVVTDTLVDRVLDYAPT